MKKFLVGCLIAFGAVGAVAQIHTVTRELANTYTQIQTFLAGVSVSNLTSGIKVVAPATVSSYTLTLPSNGGTPGYYWCFTAPAVLGFCAPPANTFSPNGDLAGNSVAPSVHGVFGIPIQGPPSANQQTLVYNATLHAWVFTIIGAPPNGHSITVTWTASVSTGVTGYNVYRSTVSGGPYTKVAPLVAGTTYNDSAVTAGNRYCYVVTSVAPSDTTTESLNSPESCSQVPAAAVQHNANITWTASTANGVTGYFVYRSTVSGGPYTKITPNLISGTAYSDGSVAAGQLYCYVVTAYAPSDTTPESLNSSQICGTIPTP